MTEQQQSIKNDDDHHPTQLTNAILKIAYDGSHFHGWSSANDSFSSSFSSSDNEENDEDEIDETIPTITSVRSRGRGRRSMAIYDQQTTNKNIRNKKKKKNPVRSVEGIIRKNLAKLYRNINIHNIVVEGCSRTDKGVHAQCLIAMFYALSDRYYIDDSEPKQSVIPGKKLPHPISSTDNDSGYFLPLPFDSDLEKLVYCLNRMLPLDVRVMDASPTPLLMQRQEEEEEEEEEVVENKFRRYSRPFHPTLDAVSKTYEYTLTIGKIHDPIRFRHVWHLEHIQDDDEFNPTLADKITNLFVGRHDFSAFRGAPRGKTDKIRTIDTVCTLSNVTIVELINEQPPPMTSKLLTMMEKKSGTIPNLKTFVITITGDRFLYKMVRFLVGTIVAVASSSSSSRKVVDFDDVKLALELGHWDDMDGYGKKQHLCAPARGLVLKDVQFGNGIMFDWIRSQNSR